MEHREIVSKLIEASSLEFLNIQLKNNGDALDTNKCELIMKEIINHILPDNVIVALYDRISAYTRRELGTLMSDLLEDPRTEDYYIAAVRIAQSKIDGRL